MPDIDTYIDLFSLNSPEEPVSEDIHCIGDTHPPVCVDMVSSTENILIRNHLIVPKLIQLSKVSMLMFTYKCRI